MKVNFTQQLRAYGDKTMRDDAGEPLTLKSVAIVAMQGAKEKNPEKRYKLGRLGERVYESGEEGIDLKSDEVALIKKCIGEYEPFTPILLYRAWDALEGENGDGAAE